MREFKESSAARVGSVPAAVLRFCLRFVRSAASNMVKKWHGSIAIMHMSSRNVRWR